MSTFGIILGLIVGIVLFIMLNRMFSITFGGFYSMIVVFGICVMNRFRHCRVGNRLYQTPLHLDCHHWRRPCTNRLWSQKGSSKEPAGISPMNYEFPTCREDFPEMSRIIV